MAAVVEKYLGAKQGKKLQRADWSARPLTPAMLEYAATDTRRLPELRDLMRERLIRAGRLAWAEEEFDLLTVVRWPEAEPPEVAALGVKGVRALSPRVLAIFRELYVWRAGTAHALDRAAFRILGNEAMVALAERPPADLARLGATPGVGRGTAQRPGTEILAAIQRGQLLPESELPRFARPPRHRPDPVFEARLERLKALRATLVERLELAPGVLCPNWLLEAIARAGPTSLAELGRVDGIRRWQVGEFGDQLLAAVKTK